MLPTYNEKDNVKIIIPQILSRHPDIKIIAVDDNSPDGTGNILDELAAQSNDRIIVLHRQEKGRGTAGIDGFKKALELGAEYILEMDADGSHDPSYINELLNVVINENYDIAVGSRYIATGGISDRGWWRNITSDIANFYNRFFLRLDHIKDTSGGYKCYKRKVLEAIDLGTLVSRGYSIGAEILYRSNKKGFKIKEIPIIFHNRTTGKSKTNTSEYFRYIWTVFVIWFGNIINIRVIHLFLAGLIGAVVNLLMFLWLVEVKNLNYIISGAIALFLNMLINLFTEKIHASLNRIKSDKSYLKFFISFIATIFMNSFLLWMMIDIAGLSILLSALIVIFIIASLNFVFNRAWIFASPARAEVYYKEVPANFYEDQLNPAEVGSFRAWYHRTRYKKLANFVEKNTTNISDLKIADLGCGSCNWNINHLPVTGVDVNKGMLELGIKTGRLIDFKEAPLDDTGLPDSGYDVVIAAEVLEHMTNPDAFFNEINRILKPGGKFLVTVPYDFFPSPFYVLFNIHCFIKGYIFEDEYYKHRCGHVLHFSKKSLKKVLSENAFKVNKMFIVNSFLIYSSTIKV